MLKGKRVLYFEGAGWEGADSSKNTIGNCRIRTAFTNNKGEKIYLEMGASTVYNKKTVVKYGLCVDHLFNITGDDQDINKNFIPIDYQDLRENYSYTTEDITRWINENLDCDFDTIMALPWLSGYRVHAEGGGYNLADNFVFDEELFNRRKKVENYFNEIEKSGGKKYPNFSLWVDETEEDVLHLLRCFNGYNKHWEINVGTDNWKDYIEEKPLGMYGC
jgi:hypothetical protein